MPDTAPQRDNFARLIALAARQWRRALDFRLQEFGLTEATWLPLLHLARAEAPMRQKDLAASLLLDSSSVVRILHGLESAGLIERGEDAEDRRAKAIVISESGRLLVAKVEDVSREVRQATLAEIDDRDIAAATETLRRVCERLASLTETEGKAR